MNTELQQIKTELDRIKVRNRILEIAMGLSLMVIAVTLFTSTIYEKTPEVIRVKGIIVEDKEGTERILIGAPIPFAENRMRTDTTRIRDTWGKRMGKKYMDWYKEYAHHTNGMLILDKNGWDKVIVGDPVPDPIIGNRIGPATGITINDDQGLERSGYGTLKVDGKLRVVLGLDHGNGTEGAALSVLPDGSVGLYLDSDENSFSLDVLSRNIGNLQIAQTSME